MVRFASSFSLGVVLVACAIAQVTPSQGSVTPSVPGTAPNNAIQPVTDPPVQPSTDANPPRTGNSAPEPSKPAKTDPTVDLDNAMDPATLIPDLPPLSPKEKASLVGGTVDKLDRVRDQIVVRAFGGGKVKISFDPRTHFYLGTNEGNPYDLKVGERVYVDTMLDGDTIFARNIRVKGVSAPGESHGTVVSYRYDKGELLVRDALSPQSLKIRVTPQTRITRGDQPGSASQLREGALVSVKFDPQQNGADVASEISILALPGSSFTFAGEVTAINMRLGIIVITSSTDHKTYEVYVDPSLLPADNSLHEASDVTVLARFDGSRYVARTVTVNRH
jgi:hypothetical protein